MLFEDDRRRERGFEAMRGAVPDDASEAPQRFADRPGLVVVRQRVEIRLNQSRRAQPADETPLVGSEVRERWGHGHSCQGARGPQSLVRAPGIRDAQYTLNNRIARSAERNVGMPAATRCLAIAS